MIALALQAAAEYMGVLLSNGYRALNGAASEAGRWIAEHPWQLGLIVLGLYVLRKLAGGRRVR